MKISKRGPSLARRWLYFAALRLVQDQSIKPWFEQKKTRDQNRGGRAVVAVMRKLALAVHAVAASDVEFDPARVSPGKHIPREVIAACLKEGGKSSGLEGRVL